MSGDGASADPAGDATRILARLDAGDPDAADELLKVLYGSLRALAGHAMGQERRDHTLQPTALVHEAWIRLFGEQGIRGAGLQDRDHVTRVIARTMRRILVDHARARRTAKRGGGSVNAGELSGLIAAYEDQGTDLVELDDALAVLAETDAELARIVELKTFGGLTMDEIAAAIGVSKATAERRWQVARMWMTRALGES